MAKIRTAKDLLEKLNTTLDDFESGKITSADVAAVTKVTSAMCQVVKTSMEVQREMLKFDADKDPMLDFVRPSPKQLENRDEKV
jgi:hypothetical protein